MYNNNDITTDKSCRTCSHFYNKSCPVPKMMSTDDIETAVHCKLEQGEFEEVLKEQLDLTHALQELQDEGIIKKNVKIDDVACNDSFNYLFIEAVSECIWKYLLREMKDLEIDTDFEDVNTDKFYCSEWR